MPAESFNDRVVRLFRGFFAEPPARPRPRITQLPFSLHLVVGASSVELFPPGPLDVLRFYQRKHASIHHELEYVTCRAAGDDDPEAFRAYAVFRLRPEEQLPLTDLTEIERTLQRSYGTLIRLPRARPLFERQYSEDLNDEDPPEGLNRVVVGEDEKPARGRLTIAEIVHIIRKELSGPEVIAWLEGAFRQPPRRGTVEHRYYLDATARLYVVRDHWTEGKILYRAEMSEAALKPERPAR